MNEEPTELSRAVRAIAHGDVNGPTGLEMLAIAVGGEGAKTSLAEVVRDGLHEVAESLHAVAEAIRETRDRDVG